jgi:hypothetical protein
MTVGFVIEGFMDDKIAARDEWYNYRRKLRKDVLSAYSRAAVW